jgi:hypothetical protein
MVSPPAATPRRVGIHLPTAGGLCRAPERAHVIGANTFQIFSSSPRMWRGSLIATADCDRMTELRSLYNCFPPGHPRQLPDQPLQPIGFGARQLH